MRGWRISILPEQSSEHVCVFHVMSGEGAQKACGVSWPKLGWLRRRSLGRGAADAVSGADFGFERRSRFGINANRRARVRAVWHRRRGQCRRFPRAWKAPGRRLGLL